MPIDLPRPRKSRRVIGWLIDAAFVAIGVAFIVAGGVVIGGLFVTIGLLSASGAIIDRVVPGGRAWPAGESDPFMRGLRRQAAGAGVFGMGLACIAMAALFGLIELKSPGAAIPLVLIGAGIALYLAYMGLTISKEEAAERIARNRRRWFG